MPNESIMPNGPQENPQERKPSPELEFGELLSRTKSKEVNNVLIDAFQAGQKGNEGKYALLLASATTPEEINEIEKAFKLGENVPVREDISSTPQNQEGLRGMLSSIEEVAKKLPEAEREALKSFAFEMAQELWPEIATEILKTGKIDKKALMSKITDKFFDKIDKLPEEIFKGLRVFKKEKPEEFKKFKIGFMEALGEKDAAKRKEKVGGLFRDYERAGEVVEEATKLIEIAVLIEKGIPEKVSDEDKKKLEEAKADNFRGLWEKIWPIGGLFLSLMLIGLILAVILALSFSDYVSGKKGK